MLDILMIKKLSKPVFAIFLMTPTVRICNAFKACALSVPMRIPQYPKLFLSCEIL